MPQSQPLNIFITGGSSGIGKALALSYLKNGHNVGVCGRDPAKFETLREYSNAKFYQADVVKRDEITSAIAQFYQDFGLDMVIASAGLSHERKTQIPDFEMSRKIIDVNLVGTLNTFEGALKIMLPNKHGHLVAIASVSALCGFPGVSAYSAAKAGITRLCESYALDLKEFGINVTCIAPGFVDTPLTRKNHHSMPFIMPAEKAAKLITTAIEKKKPYFIFPWFFGRVLTFLSIIPRPLYHFLMKFYKFNYAK